MKNKQILVELQEFMGNDESIANAAWTSTYDKDKREDKYNDTNKVSNIVTNLINDGHGTPVESVIFRFWIKMPIFTDRQHVTHRIASNNGLSARYRTMPNDYLHMPEDVVNIFAKISDTSESEIYENTCALAFACYNRQITILKDGEKKGLITNEEFKRAREIVRAQLPTSSMVERTTILNLRSFANYQKQRNSVHAQPEIQQVAQMMLEEVEKANVCPVAIAALKAKNWVI